MKYACTLDTTGEHAKWTLDPWKRKGMKTFETVANVPTDHILVVSHFAPWWSPLREYVAAGRPYIEIEYGYWGPDTPRRQTRRVTYNWHHNLIAKTPDYSRTDLFTTPAQQPWRTTPGQYVLGIQPVASVLLERTGETLEQFRNRLAHEIRPYWSGPIQWRKKTGAKDNRWPSYVEQLQFAHAVVGERTMACTEACLLGVPGFTIDASMSTLLLGGIENLANIQFPDRAAWWEHICWSQFNRSEFETTVPADLVEQYQIGSTP